MTTATMQPTAERLAKSKAWLRPQTDMSTARAYFRSLSLFDNMAQRGTISGEMYHAAQRFEQHYRGALGHDVRMSEEPTLGDADPSRCQPSAIHHGGQLADAYKQISRRQGRALDMICEGTDSLVDIGRTLCGYQSDKQASASGAVLIQEALERLSEYWGYTTLRPPSR